MGRVVAANTVLDLFGFDAVLHGGGRVAKMYPVKNTFIHFDVSDADVLDDIDEQFASSRPTLLCSRPKTKHSDCQTPAKRTKVSLRTGERSPSAPPCRVFADGPAREVNDVEVRSSDQFDKSPQSGPVFAGGFVFTVTVRLATSFGLGLDVATEVLGHMLMVRRVVPEGAMDAWNRQCSDDASPRSKKSVVPGDFVVDVNGRTNCQAMLEECKGKSLLKMTFVRAYNPAQIDVPTAEVATWLEDQSVSVGADTPLPDSIIQLVKGCQVEHLHAKRTQ